VTNVVCKGGLLRSSSGSVCSEAMWQNHGQLNCVATSLHLFFEQCCNLVSWWRTKLQIYQP
jgi:hypothetical protein